ncbi:hypothetical protein LX64_03323 [Chitinophaga skermanii]|uniref:Uncharacterized protein n=1 Tax=Chitinophaga skermanii TaxID=331697 RepID=A0A327QEW1_9BACT|nr:hypothetical protein LX64_03323 [Chitinophaga skermanii]
MVAPGPLQGPVMGSECGSTGVLQGWGVGMWGTFWGDEALGGGCPYNQVSLPITGTGKCGLFVFWGLGMCLMSLMARGGVILYGIWEGLGKLGDLQGGDMGWDG